jgi:transposase
MPTPFPVEIALEDEQRAQLVSWARRRTSAQALALRCRVVLLADRGLNNTEIARELGIDVSSARKWRSRFAAHGLDGLVDEPRPGRPRTIGDEQVEEVIIKTLETTPREATHWSTRSMAKEVGLTQSAVLRIWRAFGLQPHRQETWKLSKDPQFVAKVRDVVGLYLNPPERAAVLCVDEKSQIQALDRTAPTLPMLPGTPERATHDYKRWGTSSLFAALDITTGKVIGLAARPPPRNGVQEVSRDARSRSPRRAGRPPDPRQLLNAQDAGDPQVAGCTPTIRAAFHADLELVAKPRRALVLRAHQQEAAPRRSPLGARTQRRHPGLDRHLERRSQALRLDQDRRRNPQLDRPLLQPNQCITTLGSVPEPAQRIA